MKKDSKKNFSNLIFSALTKHLETSDKCNFISQNYSKESSNNNESHSNSLIFNNDSTNSKNTNIISNNGNSGLIKKNFFDKNYKTF